MGPPAAFFLNGWWRYFYLPHGGPWYTGNVYGNVFVGLILIPLAWFWSRTKFWPLRPINHALHGLHQKADRLAESHAALHARVEALHVRHDEHAEALQKLADAIETLPRKPNNDPARDDPPMPADHIREGRPS